MTTEERIERLKTLYKETLSVLGEDAEREGLLKTPERVAKAMLDLTRGYTMDAAKSFNLCEVQRRLSPYGDS